MSTFNSVFFQKLFCEVHEMELFFAARAETIRKTIACQTFFPKIHQIFLQNRETKEVHDAGRSQEGPAGVNSPERNAPFPWYFFVPQKSFRTGKPLSGAEPAQKPRFPPTALLYFLKELFPGIRIETAQDSGCG